MKCGFNPSWTSPCNNEAPCREHSELKCASCSAPATHQCNETGQFVCGAPLCNECEHAIAPDGTNGGVGFYTTVPEEMRATWKTHAKKGTQQFKPWYEREQEQVKA